MWIESISPGDASERLSALYRRIAGNNGHIDNILLAHSLRPHTLEGHMALYKSVLHHNANRLPKWLLEAVGVYVSRLNGCEYCDRHHSAGLARLIADPERFATLSASLDRELPVDGFRPEEQAVFEYARKLTREPVGVTEDDLQALRTAGYDDGAILELNQVISYFAYANRMVLGLGVAIDGEELGLSPSSGDQSDWEHR